MIRHSKLALKQFKKLRTSITGIFSIQTTYSSLNNPLTKFTYRSFAEEETHSDFKPKVKQEITDENVLQLIEDWVKNNDCVLFMKGTREMPKCGFSNYLVQILNHYEIKDVKVVNILESPILREAVKKYSNWPTYPQLYLKGNLVGKYTI
jgi:monothiol glutaredoxin